MTSYKGSEEDVFSKTRQKNHSKTQLNEKKLPFNDDLYNFVFLYFSTAHHAGLSPYIIKDDNSKGL